MISASPILFPVFALIVWTTVSFFWLYATRIPAMLSLKIDPQSIKNSGLKGLLPERVEAVANNYNHLMEHPTIFYAMCFYLAISTHADALDVKLAWAYVVLRVVHTLIQNTINVIAIRFPIFFISGLVLFTMIIRETLRLMA